MVVQQLVPSAKTGSFTLLLVVFELRILDIYESDFDSMNEKVGSGRGAPMAPVQCLFDLSVVQTCPPFLWFSLFHGFETQSPCIFFCLY